MRTARLSKRELLVLLIAPLLLAVAVRVLAQDKRHATPAGTTLYNQAQGSYHDLGGTEYGGASEVVAVTVRDGPRLTSPNDPSLPPYKGILGGEKPTPPYSIEGSAREITAAPGQTVAYVIAFRNSGGSPARDTVLRDVLPEGVVYIPDSLYLGNDHLSDADGRDGGRVISNAIEVRLGTVVPGQIVLIAFKVKIIAGQAGLGLLNYATLRGSNFDPINSTRALIIINPAGVVYAGHSGETALPVGSSRLYLTSDTDGTKAVTLDGMGVEPNAANHNPLTTASSAQWNFKPTLAGSPQKVYLQVSARGYRSRVVEVTLEPASEKLFDATLRALDGQRVAKPGGYSLTDQPVHLTHLAVLAFNIPLFEASTLEITKTADRTEAEISDIVTYRVELRNTTDLPLLDAVMTDSPPESFFYVSGSGRTLRGKDQSAQIEPEHLGQVLKFHLGTLAPHETVTLIYRTRIGVGARLGAHENRVTGSGHFPSGETVSTPPAHAQITVGSLLFSERQAVIGRVFEDFNGNGLYDEETDRPVAGARIYTADGRSVTTDSAGMYNFPVMNGGAIVLSLDPTTIPPGDVLIDEGLKSNRSWTRLLRHPLLGGGIIRQNFALRPLSWNSAASCSSLALDKLADCPAYQERLKQKKEEQDREAKAKADRKVNRLKAAEPSNRAAKRDQAKDAETQTTETGKEDKPRTITVALTDAQAANSLSPTPEGTPVIKFSLPNERIAPEEIIVSVENNQVILSASLEFEVRVAVDWSVEVSVNGEAASDQQVGIRKVDPKIGFSSYRYVGLNLKPGPNRLRLTARCLADRRAGKSLDLLLYGRGPVKALQIIPSHQSLQAGGRDSMLVKLKAVDEWGNPAIDGEIAIEATGGKLLKESEEINVTQTVLDRSAQPGKISGLEQAGRNAQQLSINLKNGEANFKLVSGPASGRINLKASSGKCEAFHAIQVVAELRPVLLVGIGEVSFGKASPDLSMRRDEGSLWGHLGFFYKGKLGEQNLLTLAYDSKRALNRIEGRDSLFERDPLDRIYPLFGDSSTRYDEAQSNSKLYARFDRGRHFALFGDFTLSGSESGQGREMASRNQSSLAAYGRKLTGGKIHLEAHDASFITIAGARPNTSYARDIFDGTQVGFVRLTHTNVLAGSEIVTIEIRDRRNPEIILKRETLTRYVDYQIDYLTGHIFFIRLLSTYDMQFNLAQVVVTYEHQGSGADSNIYLAQGAKNFAALGLKVGGTFIDQRQGSLDKYRLGGVEIRKMLPLGGYFSVEWAMTSGRALAMISASAGSAPENGMAYRAELEQKIPWRSGIIKAVLSHATEGFFNPFGATVTPGANRAQVTFEFRPRQGADLRLGFTEERNRTEQVNNLRRTISALWTQSLSDRLRFHLGYDFRNFQDQRGQKETSSHLLSMGAELQATSKLRLEAKREQNLAEADPTYPNQTTLGATYKLSEITKLFFTERLGAAPIIPISDLGGTGFGLSAARKETAIGVETRVGRLTSLNSRYQTENGINASDSFAILGLTNRLPIKDDLSVEVSFERAFHMAGRGKSYASLGAGFAWTPTDNFKSTLRYELRDRLGIGHIITAAAAGRIGASLTMLGRLQWTKANTASATSSTLKPSAGIDAEKRAFTSLDETAALAYRPTKSDKAALLFSYNVRSYDRGPAQAASDYSTTRERTETLAVDGLGQPIKKFELYGRLAWRRASTGNGNSLAPAGAGTFLVQGRVQNRFSTYFDVALEGRLLTQPSSHSRRSSYGAELGFWLLEDLRLAIGYNFTGYRALVSGPTSTGANNRQGVYFSLTTRLSNFFNLLGTSPQGIAGR